MNRWIVYRELAHPAVIEFFAEKVVKCEVKQDKYVKASTFKAIVKMHIQVCKARGIVQKF